VVLGDEAVLVLGRLVVDELDALHGRVLERAGDDDAGVEALDGVVLEADGSGVVVVDNHEAVEALVGRVRGQVLADERGPGDRHVARAHCQSLGMGAVGLAVVGCHAHDLDVRDGDAVGDEVHRRGPLGRAGRVADRHVAERGELEVRDVDGDGLLVDPLVDEHGLARLGEVDAGLDGGRDRRGRGLVAVDDEGREVELVGFEGLAERVLAGPVEDVDAVLLEGAAGDLDLAAVRSVVEQVAVGGAEDVDAVVVARDRRLGDIDVLR
jgi:hypothetical protein